MFSRSLSLSLTYAGKYFSTKLFFFSSLSSNIPTKNHRLRRERKNDVRRAREEKKNNKQPLHDDDASLARALSAHVCQVYHVVVFHHQLNVLVNTHTHTSRKKTDDREKIDYSSLREKSFETFVWNYLCRYTRIWSLRWIVNRRCGASFGRMRMTSEISRDNRVIFFGYIFSDRRF